MRRLQRHRQDQRCPQGGRRPAVALLLVTCLLLFAWPTAALADESEPLDGLTATTATATATVDATATDTASAGDPTAATSTAPTASEPVPVATEVGTEPSATVVDPAPSPPSEPVSTPTSEPAGEPATGDPGSTPQPDSGAPTQPADDDAGLAEEPDAAPSASDPNATTPWPDPSTVQGSDPLGTPDDPVVGTPFDPALTDPAAGDQWTDPAADLPVGAGQKPSDAAHPETVPVLAPAFTPLAPAAPVQAPVQLAAAGPGQGTVGPAASLDLTPVIFPSDPFRSPLLVHAPGASQQATRLMPALEALAAPAAPRAPPAALDPGRTAPAPAQDRRGSRTGHHRGLPLGPLFHRPTPEPTTPPSSPVGASGSAAGTGFTTGPSLSLLVWLISLGSLLGAASIGRTRVALVRGPRLAGPLGRAPPVL
jgi:hypothetical protein